MDKEKLRKLVKKNGLKLAVKGRSDTSGCHHPCMGVACYEACTHGGCRNENCLSIESFIHGSPV